MKRTTLDIDVPYKGFGYITIPRGTKVTNQPKMNESGQRYHEVIDLDIEFGIASGMGPDELRAFIQKSVYRPIRIPAKYVR